jgi:hypothetical protein
MTREPRPLRGYFAALTNAGYIWTDTISWRARDARAKCGKMFVGIKSRHGVKVEDETEGWAEAKHRGYRIIKVSVVPESPLPDTRGRQE